MNPLIGLLVGVALTFGGVAVAEITRNKTWDELSKCLGAKENKICVLNVQDADPAITCNITMSSHKKFADISCLPSLELGHPGV